MSSFHRNSSYEGCADYPGYSGSWNHEQSYLKPQDYLDFPASLDNPGFHHPRNNPYSPGSRTNPDHSSSLAEPDYSRSPSDTEYHSTRSHPYSAHPIPKPDYDESFPEPDYNDFQRESHGTDLSKGPDYAGPHRHPSLARVRSSTNYTGSRTNLGYLGTLEEPDYPGAQGHSDHPDPRSHSNQPGSRRDVGYNGSRINAYLDTLEDPDYPGAENQRNAPHFYGNPDYPGAEEGHGYGSSQPLGAIRRSNGPFGTRGRENEDYPESIEMASMEMAGPQDHSPPGDPRNGYMNTAYMEGSSPVCAVRNLLLCERDWHTSPQGQKLIASLVPMTSRDRIKTIRNQPRTMEEKRQLRKIVDKEKSKQSHGILEVNCCAQCLSSLSLAYRRAKSSLSELNSISLWQKRFKVIGGKFGTSVLSYFSFLRWLLKFNIFSFVMNFSFIIIPQFTVGERNTLQFTGLEFFTGAGYFRDTVMYYGFYTNSTIRHGTGRASYNMQLAYIFTIGACLVVCFFSLLFSMAKYFRNNFINPHIYSRGIAKLIFCWDFTVTHEKAVKLKQKNLSTEIRENLSEIRQENERLTLNQQLTHFSAHVAAWLVSTGVAAACCVAVYYLAEYNSEFLKTHRNPGAVLLLPFVVSCINLAVPRFYSMFRLVEPYEIPRQEVYVLLIRNILLKISIVGILCYYWLNIVALSGEECWETLIGQDIYRLLLMDFVFSLADSLLGEFLRRFIGMRFMTSLSLQEFDIARNVLELIYAQTLAWLGIFFCPLLPFIQMITLFIMFYVKNISLMMNFQPPSKAWRASQMITFFIFLLFFPSFTGVLCTLAITIWRLKPSADCGPFRGLPSFIQSIYSWIDSLSRRPGYLWVVWIYQNLIDSVHFFFILTLVVLIITYLYWQITEGRKVMIRLLHEQIINEGKDKMFLIEKLTKLQDVEKRANPSTLILERREVEQQSPLHLEELSDAPDLRWRRSVHEENPKA
ncbi:transmembrane channel-like protein 5 isoform X1 [Meriones unguiculatus]|uniref:transmembrane channel-like protein 5 isoform X1 n=1 Tax=Meriones unguiculatus TaxID=10047 RepID=UPI000B4E92A5|nr:transmembrane channel-like protein 5 isoform X1 [Meriones unguiculatus]XP_060222944.1 transmembrane channel-like protein 5 isoform X1 [Meriones unguiculatus]XP_060222945.1 transmembrane channel-like protein 5 isoform X1 [Meriones unguiculatus]XP_060222947.1 transmembrane channel-like protein 5 isoform X1 [Meriones unguiculatus]XP_060222948.1 transmembrane channel-like protein 5 isoform X1 [Meriones unguiculatus]